jgi:hypothetical protein
MVSGFEANLIKTTNVQVTNSIVDYFLLILAWLLMPWIEPKLWKRDE